MRTGALTGEQIRLRELHESDLADLTAWWRDPDLMTLQTTNAIHPKTDDQLSEMFREWSRGSETEIAMSVVTREAEEFAGHVALFNAVPRNRSVTFAIIMGPAYQNRGLGSDAVRTTLRYGFDELGLHRIQLFANAYNPRAIAAYHKCGFVEEGRSREAVYRSGAWHDLVHMGILEHEWRALTR